MSKTKVKNRKSKSSATKKKLKQVPDGLPSFLTDDRFFLATTAVLALIYFIYSFFSEGFYQQDGPGHYLNMRDFWRDPNSIMGTWAKPGFKIFYVLPALIGGVKGAQLVSAVYAALSAYLAYRVVKIFDKDVAFLAFFLAATAHIWFNLSFRLYSEIITALVMIAGVYWHLKDRLFLAALAFSYLGFIRMELYAVGGLYFLFLLSQKQWKAALLTATFPLLYNIWGMINHGDPLYLLSTVLNTSASYAGSWPKMGFDHFFKFFTEISGGIQTALLITFLFVLFLMKKKEWRYFFILFPPLIYFIIQTLFNWQAVKIGPGTGGNLRYMIIIAPLVAVMGALAFREYRKLDNKIIVLVGLGILFFVNAFFLSYEAPAVSFTETRKWDGTIMIGLTLLLLIIPERTLAFSKKTMILAVLSIASLVGTVRPYPLAPEDKLMSEIAEWFEDYQKSNPSPKVLTNHTMFYYFSGKSAQEFDPPAESLNEDNILAAPKGSMLLWESHYGYRPTWNAGHVPYTYLSEKPNEFKLIKQFQSSDKRFATLVFEKL